MSWRVKSWFRAALTGRVDTAEASNPREPSLWEVFVMLAVVIVLHLFMVCRVMDFWERITRWGDNRSYLQIATIIQHGHFTGSDLPQHFWGFPSAIVGVSKLFSISQPMALVLTCMLASLAGCALVHRLYGGWVAATFIFVNYLWIQVSVEGGSEPLFMCFLLASFLAARGGRWKLAALSASLSATVRPVGVFVLAVFAVVLTAKRSYRQLAVITLIGLAMGMLYVVPLWIILGNPFHNFIGYGVYGGHYAQLFTYPFGALVRGYPAAFQAPRWAGSFYSLLWLTLSLAGVAAMWFPHNFRRLWTTNRPEVLFASAYTLFLISFNAEYVALDVPRYTLPILPPLLMSVRDWIPHDRRVLWVGALFSALLASAGIVSFKNVFGFSLP